MPLSCHLCSPALRPACRRLIFSPLQRRRSGSPHEGYRRAGRAFKVAGPRPPRGRAAQYHPDPRQRAGQGRQGQAQPEGDRPRSRGHRLDCGRSFAGRQHHRAGAHVLRHRAQAARGRADRDRRLRRPRRALDPRRALALHLADFAGKRFSRSRRRRHEPFVYAAGRRPQAADRQDPVRDLDRRDALLSQRHLSARGGLGQECDATRGGDRRPSAGASANCRCRRAPPACRASSCRARRSARCSG